MQQQRPVGWWVKRLDELLERGLDDVVAAEGLSRRHWQVLDSLASGPSTRRELATALTSFATPGRVDGVVADLAARGWVEEGAGRLALTSDGRAAHGRLAGAVAAFRRRVAEGLSAEEYAATVAGLARMVANLEREAPGQPRR
ncbi:DNA-binding MarR family transcriptional regulator [Geodermatophilus normandii]|uniref:DNA-binding MarR family transcriptional regulator n=1 Tax=Geodermatophilus normandii TaxID=1137989 RepID=A0A317QSU8_9ACTN|nr:MarR family winged helix-turn-helix transcriptional regulator [Geodermatophilus normandii]PWW25215.1 DNA-binding MarR family transcriptional regulator [Geodermatophilus normandii]